MAPIRWQPDRTTPKPPWPVPSLATALGRGFVGRCPACGKGRLFDGFLRVVPLSASTVTRRSAWHAPTMRRRTSPF